MAPGTIRELGGPMFELELFKKQMYCVEGSTCGIVGIFCPLPVVIRRLHSDSVPGEFCPPCPPFVTPLDRTPMLILSKDRSYFDIFALNIAVINTSIV